MKVLRFPFWILLSAFVWGAGCATPKHDPLEGWKSVEPIGYKVGEMQAYIEEIPGNKIISDDVQKFVNKLPVDRGEFGDRRICYWIDHLTLFKGGTGQHAVKIEIPWNGTYWNYVLIYNNSDKRIKTIKYSNGHYRS